MVKTSPILVLELKVCNTKKIVNPMEKKGMEPMVPLH
jgi:hypothetical protein